MLVITNSFGLVPHRRYTGYRIEKVGFGCRGGVGGVIAEKIGGLKANMADYK